MGISLAQSTQRAYSRQWNLWTEWALSNGCSVLPANPTSVAAYLSRCVEAGASQSVVKLARSAIAGHHRDACQPDPTHGEDVKRLVAGMVLSAAERDTNCISSNEHHECIADCDLSHEGGYSHQLELVTLGATKGSKRYGKSDFLERLKPGQAPAYATARGEAWVGDSRRLLKKIQDESIDLETISKQ